VFFRCRARGCALGGRWLYKTGAPYAKKWMEAQRQAETGGVGFADRRRKAAPGYLL